MTNMRLAVLALLTAAFAACDAISEPLPNAGVAGTYIAAESWGAMSLTTITDGVTFDWVAVGARVEIELLPDGSTRGLLVAPGAGPEGEPFEADLEGTWLLTGSTLRLVHEADTFLRDMPLTVRGNNLEGEKVFGDVRIRLVLAKH